MKNNGGGVLIIPTYNERDNIVALIRAFLATAPDVEVLVADSDSLDKTGQLVTRVFAEEPRVTLLPCERKQGRGAAIREAYRWIRQHRPAALVGIADADFSHDPRDWPQLVAALANADVVIGSRYLPGSQIIGWPLGRRLFSQSANWLARLVLRVVVRDYTNGYRLFTPQALAALPLDDLDADGLIMLSQELIAWHRAGLCIF